eukprot:SAG31_NODE_17328_length_675_cov_0.796875_1_plen_113_part_00
MAPPTAPTIAGHVPRAIITRRYKKTAVVKARRIMRRAGFDLSDVEWLRIAPRRMLDLVFENSRLVSNTDVLEALVLNMLARARLLGFRAGYAYLIDALDAGYAHLIAQDMHI